MGLEIATYLSQLNNANPTGGDGRYQGDDHVRLLKSVLQNTFKKADGTTPWDTSVSVDPANVSGGWIPVGGTIMFQGDPATIPANWQLSDGTNGTSDLRNRFIVGGYQFNILTQEWETNVTGSDTTSGGYSGSGTTNTGSTTLTNTDPYTLTVADIPSHRHFLVANNSTAGASALADGTHSLCNYTTGFRQKDPDVNATLGMSSSVGGDGGHSHGLTGTAHVHTVAKSYPQYYALAFIVRMT